MAYLYLNVYCGSKNRQTTKKTTQKTTKNSFEVDKMDYIVVGIMNVAV